MVSTAKNTNTKTSVAQEVQESILEKVQKLVTQSLSDDVDTSLIGAHISKILQKSDKKLALHYLKKSDIGLYEYLPEKLKRDEDIIKEILEQNPSLYHTIPLESQKNPKLQQYAIEKLVAYQKPISELLTLLELTRNNKKDFPKVMKKLQNLLDKSKNYLKDPFDALLFTLYKEDYRGYQKMSSGGILDTSMRGLSDKFTQYLQKHKGEFIGLSEEEIGESLYEKVLGFLKLGPDNSPILEKFLLHITQSISLQGITPKVEDENSGEDEEIENGDTDSQTEGDTEVLLSNYSYSSVGTSSYTVWDDTGTSIQISEKNLQTMSSRALENYFTFYHTLQDLGIGFLLKKHAEKISIATGVNFYEGEGMSEAKMLKFLNSVGKNIGIPEESYEDEEGNKKVSCFRNLDAAKLAFKEVKSSGKIGDFDSNGLNLGNKTIIEVYLKLKGLIVLPFDEISIAKWV